MIFFGSAIEASAQPPAYVQQQIDRIDELSHSRIDAAIEQSVQLLRSLPEGISADDRRDVLIELIRLYINSEQMDQVKKYSDELSALGSKYNDVQSKVMGLNYQTYVLRAEGKMQDANAMIEGAISQTKNIKITSLNKRRLFMTASLVNLELGDFKMALQYQLSALDLIEAGNARDSVELVNSYNSIGNLYLKLKDTKMALMYVNQGINLAERINSRFMLAMLQLNLGNIYLEQGKLNDATKAYLESLRISREISAHWSEINALTNLASVAFTDQKYSQCLDYAGYGLALATKMQDNVFRASNLINIGTCQIALNRNKPGVENVGEGLKIFRQLMRKADLVKSLGQIALSYEKAGMYREAYQTKSEEYKVSSELTGEGIDVAISQMQIKYDISDREKQINILKANTRLQDVEIKNTKLQILAVVLFVLFAVSIGVVLLRSKEKLRQQAFQENRNKSKFIADAAHDLRQPMHAIGNLIEATKQAIARRDIEKCQKLVTLTESAARAMHSSFNSILELSRLESGLVKADYLNFDLNSLIEEVINSMKPVASDRGVTIRVRMNRNRASIVYSDRVFLSRVISNLVSNAIKYHDFAKMIPTVIVGVTSLPRRYRVDIVDNGIGIAASDLDNVFKPFFQIENSEMDNEKGLGLGLSIVDSTIKLLKDHHYRFRSVQGRGTKISIEIPKGDHSAAIDQHISSDSLMFDLTGLYILYVEDDELARASMEALMEEYGVLFESASSVEQLLEKLPLLERMPDIVVTDYSLPRNHTAKDVISAVANEFGMQLPTIVVTGDDRIDPMPGESKRFLVLRKPLSPQVFLEKIHELSLQKTES